VNSLKSIAIVALFSKNAHCTFMKERTFSLACRFKRT
jgi:hypothetical protein